MFEHSLLYIFQNFLTKVLHRSNIILLISKFLCLGWTLVLDARVLGCERVCEKLDMLQCYKDLNVFCKCVKLILRMYLNSMQVVHGTSFLLLLVWLYDSLCTRLLSSLFIFQLSSWFSNRRLVASLFVTSPLFECFYLGLFQNMKLVFTALQSILKEIHF